MPVVWTKNGIYQSGGYTSEADLEAAILQVGDHLFGSNRIYLPVKKKIGAKGGLRNIPDGYLIDLSGSEPRLFVVENELAAHDPPRHIAVHILQFSLSFEEEQHSVKKLLFEAPSAEPEAKTRCEQYAKRNGFWNLDCLLERLAFETPLAALVIIDEIPENLDGTNFGGCCSALLNSEGSETRPENRFWGLPCAKSPHSIRPPNPSRCS